LAHLFASLSVTLIHACIIKKKLFTKLRGRINMKALLIVEKGGVLLRLVLSVVVFGLVCCCIVGCVVAFSLVKEVTGWRYFADVASISFSEKNHIAACDMVFLGLFMG
jgi:hypothetical protein